MSFDGRHKGGRGDYKMFGSTPDRDSQANRHTDSGHRPRKQKLTTQPQQTPVQRKIAPTKQPAQPHSLSAEQREARAARTEAWNQVIFAPHTLQSSADAALEPTPSTSGGAIQFAKKKKDDGPKHRGRLQIQGGGLELSWPWAQSEQPPSAKEALGGLSEIWGQLSKGDKKTRDEAYEKTTKYIASAAPDGVAAPIMKTFQNKNLGKNNKDHRVDIEVRKGTAFVG